MFLRLYTLLLVLVLASSSWAAFGAVSGTAVLVFLLGLAIHVWAGKSCWSRSFRVAAALLCLLALVGLLLPAINAARESARGIQCQNNLKQIGLALQNYRGCYGCYPPACTYDETGRPMHSWRFLILPFLESMPTYSSCNLNEPWDAPSNRALLADHKYVYKCPDDQTAYAPDSNTTSYLAVVGRRAAWRLGENEIPEDGDLQKHAADTFLVIETANSGIQWPEPRDIRFDDVDALRSMAANGPHMRDNGYFVCKTPAVNAVLFDGDMIFMFPWDSKAGVLTGLLPPEVDRTSTPHDSKGDYDPDEFYVEKLPINYPHCIGLPICIVAVGLLFYQATRRRRAAVARPDG
ncbi:MAG: DUF1559 domain-containing protein [Thermoguttaceae bacterium]